jgi:hypothetical protein
LKQKNFLIREEPIIEIQNIVAPSPRSRFRTLLPR